MDSQKYRYKHFGTIMDNSSSKTDFIYIKGMESKIKLNENLSLLLKINNLSADQISRKISVNKSSLHNYLNGVIPQGLPALIKLCDLFKISLDELIFEIEEENLNKRKKLFQEEKYEVTIKKIKR